MIDSFRAYVKPFIILIIVLHIIGIGLSTRDPHIHIQKTDYYVRKLDVWRNTMIGKTMSTNFDNHSKLVLFDIAQLLRKLNKSTKPTAFTLFHLNAWMTYRVKSHRIANFLLTENFFFFQDFSWKFFWRYLIFGS